MNLGELRDQAYNYTGQTATQNNSGPAEVDVYLNQGQNMVHGEVCRQFQSFFSTTGLLSEVADTSVINLPVDCYQLKRVERILPAGASGDVVPYTIPRIKENRHEIESGRFSYVGPERFASPLERGYLQLGQKQIELVPAPAESRASSLKIYYISKPAAMTSNTHVPFQGTAGTGGIGKDDLEEFHDMLWMWAAIMMLNKEGSLQEAGALGSMFATRKMDLLNHLDQMNLSDPDYVSQEDAEDFFDVYS